MASLPETSKSFKLEQHSSYLLHRINSTKILAATSHLLFRISILTTVVLILLFTLYYPLLLLSHFAIGSVSSAHSYNHQSDPQPAVVWASSSSVYGLNTESPFSELHRTDRPASLYAATKKAGEAITHTYNHIYGLSITGLRFFTVYGPWGRPDMAYFSFTNDILSGKPITLFRTHDGGAVQRDFTYIDDVVRGCLGALDTVERSTGSGGMLAPAVDEGPGCSPEEASHCESRKDQSSASSVPAAANASKAFSVSGVVSGGEFTSAEGPSTAAESEEGCLAAWRAVVAWICWWVRGQAAEMQGGGESGKLSRRPHFHRRTPLYRIFPTADASDGALPPPVFFPIITKESVVKKRPAMCRQREFRPWGN